MSTERGCGNVILCEAVKALPENAVYLCSRVLRGERNKWLMEVVDGTITSIQNVEGKADPRNESQINWEAGDFKPVMSVWER